MNDHYFKFIIKKMKNDIILDLFENKMIKDINNIENIINNTVEGYFNTIIIKEIQNKFNLGNNICKACVWNRGLGGQCSKEALINGYCKDHTKPIYGLGGDNWWLGTIHKPFIIPNSYIGKYVKELNNNLIGIVHDQHETMPMVQVNFSIDNGPRFKWIDIGRITVIKG